MLGNLFDRLAALEISHKELQQSHKELQQSHKELQQSLNELQQSHKELEFKVAGQGAELEARLQGSKRCRRSDSGTQSAAGGAGGRCVRLKYAEVLRRSLLEDTYKYFEQVAGPREASESWRQYVERHRQQLDFPVTCVGLIPKGKGTPFQQGCNAAHALRKSNLRLFLDTCLEGMPEDSQGPWVELVEFVQEKKL